jgi:Protein of unknown function (DUF2393)
MPMSAPQGIPPPDEPRPYAVSQQESETPWVPIIIGAVIVLVAIGVIFFFTRRGAPTTDATPPAYAASLPLDAVHLSTAQNFAGQSVTYLEGRIQNTGEQTVDGITVQIAFKNSLGEVVQRETQQLMVITTRQPYIDTASLKNAPLKPGQTREFRLTFEHVSADWNQQTPEMKILRVSTR